MKQFLARPRQLLKLAKTYTPSEDVAAAFAAICETAPRFFRTSMFVLWVYLALEIGAGLGHHFHLFTPWGK